MTHEEAEMKVLHDLEVKAQQLKCSRDPQIASWASLWEWRLHHARSIRQNAVVQRPGRRRRRAAGWSPQTFDQHYFHPPEAFTDVAEQFGMSPIGLCELLCELFAKANPRRLVLGRPVTFEEVEQACLAAIPEHCR